MNDYDRPGVRMRPRLLRLVFLALLASGLAIALVFAVDQRGKAANGAAGAGASALAASGQGMTVAQPALLPRSALPSPEAGSGLAAGELLVGTREGLFLYSVAGGAPGELWTGGEVRKIIHPAQGQLWYILTSKGIFATADLGSFTDRSLGLPFKTYKDIVGGQKVFTREVMDLKDLECDPSGATLVTCTKDEVWLSRDSGATWSNLGSPSPTTGLKCVALAPMPGSGEAAVWAAHPIKGLFARKLAARTGWVQADKGLFTMPTMKTTDEVADLLWVPTPALAAQADASTAQLTQVAAPAPSTRAAAAAAAPAPAPAPARAAVPAGRLWAGNSYQCKVFRSEGGQVPFTQAFDDGRDFGTAESLAPLPDGSVRFVTAGAVMRISSAGDAAADTAANALAGALGAAFATRGLLSAAWNEGGATTGLSELWLLAPDRNAGVRKEAAGKDSLYFQAGYIVNPASRTKYLNLIRDKGLNSLVVDLKDDYGKLRYAPNDPIVKAYSRYVNPMDVEAVVSEAHARGIWLVARIPVFKDQVLAAASGSRFAVWDAAAKRPWQGWRMVKPDPATSPAPAPLVRQNYEEHWVDPYSEDVWAYNVAIANEIVARGFDEVQFDYIRFPTDGVNLGDASYRWKDAGMDRESAITSFLAFARGRIAAPISIDIYGANGWYRSGARTGQDVETLAKYVDVICPMFYPSHFEQGFLAQAPAIERPGRIYRLGSLRNAHIARGRIIVRPYVQAFYMGVSYDRSYYNPDYVAREVAGVISGQNLGMTFWNNVARYEDVPWFMKSEDGGLVIRSAGAGSPPAAGNAAVISPAAAPAAKAAAEGAVAPDPTILE